MSDQIADEVTTEPSPRVIRSDRLTFSPQNTKFHDTEFSAHIMEVAFTKLGNLKVVLGIDYTWKDELLPNITYATGAPIRVTIEKFDGAKHKMRGE